MAPFFNSIRNAHYGIPQYSHQPRLPRSLSHSWAAAASDPRCASSAPAASRLSRLSPSSRDSESTISSGSTGSTGIQEVRSTGGTVYRRYGIQEVRIQEVRYTFRCEPARAILTTRCTEVKPSTPRGSQRRFCLSHLAQDPCVCAWLRLRASICFRSGPKLP